MKSKKIMMPNVLTICVRVVFALSVFKNEENR